MSAIAELFSRDPLELTKEDITETVAYYRNSRSQYLNANVRAKSAVVKPGKVASPSLADLGL